MTRPTCPYCELGVGDEHEEGCRYRSRGSTIVTAIDLGLGSDGRYSKPDEPVCAGCDQPIVGEPVVWEVGAQWHPACVPPMGVGR